ncbi:hypothetical protein DWY99_00750 [[Clostridium] leptum]|uniref:Uncharacterized protein n=1 Tax=[Clostridium] leptum TaxID=1535 RepID=A0A412B1J6_9FIRM|nr:hypothetical protein DWY99_00750 [[Clostridium] leptum]
MISPLKFPFNLLKIFDGKGRLGAISAGLFKFLFAEPRGSWLLCPSSRKLSFLRQPISPFDLRRIFPPLTALKHLTVPRKSLPLCC